MDQILKSTEWDEYKVIFASGGTYYTTDKDDALATLKDVTGSDDIKIRTASAKQNENW